MKTIIGNKGTFTLLKRTMSLGDDGDNCYDGYEEWLMDIKGQKFYYTADLYNLDFYKKRERVINVDFYHESGHGLSEQEKFTLTGKAGYSARQVILSLIELTVSIIEPVRHFRYVVFTAQPKWKPMHNFIIKRFGCYAKPSIVNQFYKAIENDVESNLSKLIDMEYYHCLMGDLYINPIWRQNNNLPALEKEKTGS
jgi:hypothetical protein